MWDSLTRTLLLLTFVTGILDAVSFLALGQVFAAMQTGNVIFLGLGIGDAPGAPLLAPLIALGAFLAGGLGAALLARQTRPGVAGLRFALALEVLLIGGAALFAALVDVEPERASAYALIATLSLTMGLRNTVARQIGDPSLTTTVLNLTLTGLTAHAPTGIVSETEISIRAAALGAIVAGAAAGALLLRGSLELALAVAALLALAAAGATAARVTDRPVPTP